MRRNLCVFALLAVSIATISCQQNQKPASDPIRDAIRQHLSALKTLNLSAMEINVTNVSMNGNTAQAQVEFVPKTGAPPGAAMRVSYSLEKRDDQWVVVKTNSLGGAIDHTAAGANPHVQPGQGDVHGNLPNFRDIIPSTTPDANSALPPGHPPIPSTQKPSP
jgi:hypothetical protein